ncbi:MAG TPA: substrate-binding domain-containing protein [Candidatus Binataceae bacterium]
MATIDSNSTRKARVAAGLSQMELARRAGVSRQALGAIESGAYQPGVSVALKIARELGHSVESLFGAADSQQVSASWAADSSHPRPARETRVALARVNGRVIATPQSVSGFQLVSAAGLIEQAAGTKVTVAAFRSREQIESTLLLAGCDPAVAILSDWMARQRAPVEVVTIPCSSRSALDALTEHRAHAAGIHLRDRSGGYNLDPARSLLKLRRAVLINFARWEIGLAVAAASRNSITKIEDLVRRGVRIVNREAGSGARRALDDSLQKLGITPDRIAGYGREAGGHLEVAFAISSGEADAGVTIRLAAQAYGLGFIPIREERYDFVIPKRELESPAMRAMLDALNSSRFSRELASLCGYDTRMTGTRIERDAEASHS